MAKSKIELPVGVPESEREDYERVLKEAKEVAKKGKKGKK